MDRHNYHERKQRDRNATSCDDMHSLNSRTSSSHTDGDRHSQYSTSHTDGDRHSQCSSSRRDSDRHTKHSTSHTDGDRHSRHSTSHKDGDKHSQRLTSHKDDDRPSQHSTSHKDGDRYSRHSTSHKDGGKHSQNSTSHKDGDMPSQHSISHKDIDKHSQHSTLHRDSDRHTKHSTSHTDNKHSQHSTSDGAKHSKHSTSYTDGARHSQNSTSHDGDKHSRHSTSRTDSDRQSQHSTLQQSMSHPDNNRYSQYSSSCADSDAYLHDSNLQRKGDRYSQHNNEGSQRPPPCRGIPSLTGKNVLQNHLPGNLHQTDFTGNSCHQNNFPGNNSQHSDFFGKSCHQSDFPEKDLHQTDLGNNVQHRGFGDNTDGKDCVPSEEKRSRTTRWHPTKEEGMPSLAGKDVFQNDFPEKGLHQNDFLGNNVRHSGSADNTCHNNPHGKDVHDKDLPPGENYLEDDDDDEDCVPSEKKSSRKSRWHPAKEDSKGKVGKGQKIQYTEIMLKKVKTFNPEMANKEHTIPFPIYCKVVKARKRFFRSATRSYDDFLKTFRFKNLAVTRIGFTTGFVEHHKPCNETYFRMVFDGWSQHAPPFGYYEKWKDGRLKSNNNKEKNCMKKEDKSCDQCQHCQSNSKESHTETSACQSHTHTGPIHQTQKMEVEIS